MKYDSEFYDVIVIGGGPSGMMAAGTAAKNGAKVLLIEKNADLGEKLKITGGGRCNITNYELDNRKLLKHYGEAEPFLYSPFSQFSVKDTFTFFEKKKLPLVIQARNRVFPKTERAYDVYLVLKKFLKDVGVKVIYQAPVIDIQFRNNEIIAVDTKKTRYQAKKYIFSVGGVSAPETGSTGDGFKWLEKLGHHIHKPSPDIVPLKSNANFLKDLSGTSLSFTKISFFLNGEKQFSKKGKILFTHFGLSSPLILNLARDVRKLLDQGEVYAEIDFFPDTHKGNLDKRLLKLLQKYPNRDLKNILPEILPKKLAQYIVQKLAIHKKANELTREERKSLREEIKHFKVPIQGLMGMDRAVVADGGVSLEEIDTKTMQSKLIKNLFVTGDMLHINRPSGGYSLQLCWTTGYVAGKHASKKENEKT